MIELADNLQRCHDCQKPWVQQGSLQFWHEEYRKWLNLGLCDEVPDGLDPFEKAIDRSNFKYCLNEWFSNDPSGRAYKSDLKIASENGDLLGYRFQL